MNNFNLAGQVKAKTKENIIGCFFLNAIKKERELS